MTLVLAHRGARRQAPENTIPAFARRWSSGPTAWSSTCTAPATRPGRPSRRRRPARRMGRAHPRRHPRRRPRRPRARRGARRVRGLAREHRDQESAPRPRLGPSRGQPIWSSSASPTARRPRLVIVSSFDLATVDRVRMLADHVPTALLTFVGDPLEALLAAETHGHWRCIRSSASSLAEPRARWCSGRTSGGCR